MNFFITKGQCRICGKISCCSNHQKEHERLEHKEYIYLLEKLPIMCRKCCRSIRSVYDLHSNCHPYMNQHLMNGNFNKAATLFNKPNRKRTLNQARKLNGSIPFVALPHNERKKLEPIYKFKRTNIRKLIAHTENGQQTFVIEVNQILVHSTPSAFSPQLNISYKMLINSIVKSSTPLNEEEKENASPIIDENLKQSQNIHISPDLIVYKSQESPAIVISAKKNTPPGIISNTSKRLSKKVLKNRRVTFELAKRAESEQNFTIYDTPNATMELLEDIDERRDGDFTIITSSPPKYAPLLLNIMKTMLSAINYIPRTFSTAWDWSNQKLEKFKSNDEKYDDEVRSPMKKRSKYDTADSLVRKPISSYWVNMSANSLFRKPLPNYVQRFSSSEDNYF